MLDIRSIVSSVVVALFVSLVGGSLSMYVSWKLIEQKMFAIETRVTEHDSLIRENRRNADERLEQISRDVSYLRGRAEGEMAKGK